jgi:hypothetical protein
VDEAYPAIDPVGQTSVFRDQNSFFSLFRFFQEVNRHLQDFAEAMLSSPDSEPIDLALSNTLVCLTENEMKYLPLWAGGCDDDSSGVFSGDIPIAPASSSFVTAGPSVHVEGSNASSSTGSCFGEDGSEFGMSAGTTVQSSRIAHDGWGELKDRRVVYTDSESGSLADTESSWDDVPRPTGDGDDADMVQVAEAIELSLAVQQSSGNKGKGKEMASSEDESYDDIFVSLDDDDMEYDMDENSSQATVGDSVSVECESDEEAMATETNRGSNTQDSTVANSDQAHITGTAGQQQEAGVETVVAAEQDDEDHTVIKYVLTTEELDAMRP